MMIRRVPFFLKKKNVNEVECSGVGEVFIQLCQTTIDFSFPREKIREGKQRIVHSIVMGEYKGGGYRS